MRRLVALPALVFATGVSLCAQSPSGSAQHTITVSVQVVRPCAIDAHGGSASVNCGQPLASQTSSQASAPQPIVTESARSADSAVTVQF
jgi:hypothetical protein